MALAYELDSVVSQPRNEENLTGSVLIADASPIVRQMLTVMLSSWGFKVVAVEDGVEAWSELSSRHYAFALVDVQLPRLKATALCRRITRLPASQRPYVFCLADGGEETFVDECITEGADDLLTKPLDLVTLRVRVRKAKEIQDLRIAAPLGVETAGLSNMRAEIESAARYQRSMIPTVSKNYGGLTYDVLFRPHSHVSGDTFNYFDMDGRGSMFYLADVAGHGIGSGLLASTINTVVQPDSCAYRTDNGHLYNVAGRPIATPADLVADLNGTFEQQSKNGLYFAMAAGFWDTEARLLTFCQAGAPYPILIPAEGRIREVGTGGFPVGLLPDVEFENETLKLQKGDRVIFYSDGVTECPNASGEQFGSEHFRSLLQDARSLKGGEILKRVEGALRDWAGRDDFGDDVSLLCAECSL